MRPRILRAATRLASALLLGLGAAIAFSWPLLPRAARAWTSARMESDLSYSLLAHWWAGEIWAGHQGFTHSTVVWFPEGASLVDSTWNLVVLMGTGWLHLLAPPLLAWNLSVLLIMAANAAAFWWLGSTLGGRAGGILASAVAISVPFTWFQAFEGRLEQAFIAPAALVALAGLAMSRRRPHAGTWLGLSVALTAAAYWFAAPLLALGVLPLAARRHSIRPLAVAAGVATLAALPFALPVLGHAATATQAVSTSQAIFMQRLASVTPWKMLTHGGPTHLPLLATAGLLAALFVRRARPWAVMAVIGMALAAGPLLTWNGAPVRWGEYSIGLPLGALDWLPLFRRFWWPERAIEVVILAAAGALAVLTTRLPARTPLALLGAALLLAEGRATLLRSVAAGDPKLPPSSLDPSPDEPFFAINLPDCAPGPQDQGAMLSFPLRRSPGGPVEPLRAHLAAWDHRSRVSGDGAGVEGVEPPVLARARARHPTIEAWARGRIPDDPTDVAQLRDAGIRWIVWNLPSAARAPTAHRTWRAEAQALEALLGPPTCEGDLRLSWDLETRP